MKAMVVKELYFYKKGDIYEVKYFKDMTEEERAVSTDAPSLYDDCDIFLKPLEDRKVWRYCYPDEVEIVKKEKGMPGSKKLYHKVKDFTGISLQTVANWHGVSKQHIHKVLNGTSLVYRQASKAMLLQMIEKKKEMIEEELVELEKLKKDVLR